MSSKFTCVCILAAVVAAVRACDSARQNSYLPADHSLASLRPIAEKWAPLVRLAHGEEYKPSSVDFFLERVTLHGTTYNAHNLPKCNSGCKLQSKESLSCNSCRLGFFSGQNIAENNGGKVPTYVMVRKPTGNIVDFVYWFFYPYNRGKNVCVGYYLNNVCPCFKVFGRCVCPRITQCIGGHSTFGHHVGDWEYVTIRFLNNRLYSIYLSIHDSAVTNRYGGEFLWTGSTFRRPDGTTLHMDHCTHARVYSAAGSHGLWPRSGKHVYKDLGNGDTLTDDCSDGASWETWKNLKLFELRQDDNYEGEFTFMRFAGRWGNSKQGCGLVEKVSGECMLNDGPEGPQYKGFVKGSGLGKREAYEDDDDFILDSEREAQNDDDDVKLDSDREARNDDDVVMGARRESYEDDDDIPDSN